MPLTLRSPDKERRIHFSVPLSRFLVNRNRKAETGELAVNTLAEHPKVRRFGVTLH
jgi:hypothetical protein